MDCFACGSQWHGFSIVGRETSPFWILKLEDYYEDCCSIKETYTHDGEAYSKVGIEKTDGVKSGIIDNMFNNEVGNEDGGAIQYITPINIEILRD